MKTKRKRLPSLKNSYLSGIIVFIAIIIAGNSQAQTTPPPTTPPSLLPPFNCAIEEGASGGLRSTPCSPSSDTWLNDYRTPGHWIPDSSTPLKTIKVNWIVCQDDDGNGWQDIPDFHNRVDEFFTELNSRFSNIPIKGYQLTCDPNATHIVDSKIRFELGEIYFLQNDDWYNLGRFNSVTPLLDHLFTVHPEARTGLNHIFSNGSGAGAFGMYTWSNGESIVRTFSDNPLMFSDWWMPMEWVGHLAHEYGHALGLHHTYGSERKNINHYDFLDDVFGTCAEPVLLPGGSCHEGCNPDPDEICYFNACFWDQFPWPHDIMSGAMEGNFYT